MCASMTTRLLQLLVDDGLADEHVVKVHVDGHEVVATKDCRNIAAENQEIPTEQQEVVAPSREIESLEVGDPAGRRSLVLVDAGR